MTIPNTNVTMMKMITANEFDDVMENVTRMITANEQLLAICPILTQILGV